jgi:hypothetical protein
MRLVVQYSYGDDFTWSATATVPINFESPESFIVEFEKACKEAVLNDKRNFIFADLEWEPYLFFEWSNKEQRQVFILPDVLTIDEWFKDVK